MSQFDRAGDFFSVVVNARRLRYASSRASTFTWTIVCRSGVISFGTSADFLVCIVRARQQKARLAAMFLSSTFRVQLLCPNGQRVSRIDIKAALLALADARIHAAVLARLDASAAVPPEAQARTERTASASRNLVDASQSIFCQAGVVAPPDGLTGETSTVHGFVEVGA
jgi:hypothetical protein